MNSSNESVPLPGSATKPEKIIRNRGDLSIGILNQVQLMPAEFLQNRYMPVDTSGFPGLSWIYNAEMVIHRDLESEPDTDQYRVTGLGINIRGLQLPIPGIDRNGTNNVVKQSYALYFDHDLQPITNSNFISRQIVTDQPVIPLVRTYISGFNRMQADLKEDEGSMSVIDQIKRGEFIKEDYDELSSFLLKVATS